MKKIFRDDVAVGSLLRGEDDPKIVYSRSCVKLVEKLRRSGGIQLWLRLALGGERRYQSQAVPVQCS